MHRILLLSAALGLSACNIQTTSGAAYLAEGPITSRAVAEAAAIEPDLEFPARIAVAQTVYGRLTEVQDVLVEVATPVLTHPQMGEMIALTPIMWQFADLPRNAYGQRQLENFRALAASRHADYLLIIALDPTRNTAEALFVDVRSGYPYATATADVAGRGATNFWGNRLRNTDRIDREADRLARALAPELVELFQALVDAT